MVVAKLVVAGFVTLGRVILALVVAAHRVARVATCTELAAIRAQLIPLSLRVTKRGTAARNLDEVLLGATDHALVGPHLGRCVVHTVDAVAARALLEILVKLGPQVEGGNVLALNLVVFPVRLLALPARCFALSAAAGDSIHPVQCAQLRHCACNVGS